MLFDHLVFCIWGLFEICNLEFGISFVPRTPKNVVLHESIEKLTRLQTSSILLVRKAPQGISQNRGRLGIFPASFNPPTRAHLALIRKARRLCHLDEVLVLLDAQAMDKKIIGTDLEDRVIMLKRLFQKDPKVSIGISNRGLFVEKMVPLRKVYPSPISFTFIVGFDTILRVLDRRYYKNLKKSLDKLFKESHFLVGNRDERDQETYESFFQHSDNEKYKKGISFLVLPKEFSSISSSLVRDRLREGKPVRKLVPFPVLRFIEETGLYTGRYQRGEI
ncbi:MAG: hypothetical protein A2170_04140 [Deltaproteobacteria bacterium RBG_13_53_10]|nr:MAG: hypothetical protein A2170_04140 [Deltaproteobacteria bacterium RBG_13_53_10]